MEDIDAFGAAASIASKGNSSHREIGSEKTNRYRFEGVTMGLEAGAPESKVPRGYPHPHLGSNAPQIVRRGIGQILVRAFPFGNFLWAGCCRCGGAFLVAGQLRLLTIFPHQEPLPFP
jgi:hypothetical protein